jgi:hypothetical protein
VFEPPIDKPLKFLVTELDEMLQETWQEWRKRVPLLSKLLAKHYPLLDKASSGKMFQGDDTQHDLQTLYDPFKSPSRGKLWLWLSIILVPAFTMVGLIILSIAYSSDRGEDWFFLSAMATGFGLCFP